MNLHFKSVSLRNFLPFGNVDVELTLDSHQRTLVLADNGTGKTALIFDSVFFALYGSVSKKLKKGQIVNTINGQDCRVTLNLEVDGVETQIIRGIGPDIFEVHIGGEPKWVDLSGPNRQRELENFIKLPKNIIEQLFFVGIDNEPFMSRTPAGRREFIDHVFSMQAFTRMTDITASRVKAAKKELGDMTAKITDFDNQISNFEELLGNCRLPDQEALDAAIALLDEKTPGFQKDREALKKAQEKAEEISGKLAKLNMVLTGKKRELKRLEDADTTCPTCGQEVDTSHLQKEIDALKPVIADLEEKKKKGEAAEAKATAECDSREAKLRKLSDELKEAAETKRIEESVDATMADALNEKIKKATQARDDLTVDSALKSDDLDRLNNLLGILRKGIAKETIIEMYLPFINTQINKYLSDLGLQVHFEFNSKFEETFKARYKDSASYDSFSAGQQARIDFALLLTWRDVTSKLASVTSNICVFDEFAARLDERGTREFADMLGLVEDVNFIALAPKPLDAEFDRTIRLKTKQNFTIVEEA